MPFDQERVGEAIARQEDAARDPADQVRLVAGPGSGKSFAIEGRVAHLVRSGVPAGRLMAVSFTRNSSMDLEDRIRKTCADLGLEGADQVRVGTLHSVALRVLRLANLLTMYPVDPRVLDDWETREWIDAEFARFADVTPGRARDVREFHEAWWSTGQQNPANYVPAAPPVTAQEQQQFTTFHNMQTGFYGCLMVGEIVRGGMQHAKANAIDPRFLLDLDHLIVDEYQDLNPMDLELVDYLAGQGVTIFAAGDDDQSVYSFRHASPGGIQTFMNRFPTAGDHKLSACFRCTPTVLDAALGVLSQFASPSRISKDLSSLYATSDPVVAGHAHWWKFGTPQAEAEAIAKSCLNLKESGLAFGDVMVLLGNRRVTAATIQEALEANGVPFSPVQVAPYRDTPAGRTAFALLRVLTNSQDLVALRTLLALQPMMGPGRCLDVTTRCREANLNALDLFQGHIPNGVLTKMQRERVEAVRAVSEALATWDVDETLTDRGEALADIVEQVSGHDCRADWQAFASSIPPEATLREVCDLLYSSNLEESATVLIEIRERLGLPPEPTTDPDRVQVMTMHGAKGLSAKVVFIPGLEETVFPNQRRAAKPGLVDEGARLLYVSITRARAAVFLTGTHGRYQNGAYVQNPVSRYLPHSGLVMEYRQDTTGVDVDLAGAIVATSNLL